MKYISKEREEKRKARKITLSIATFIALVLLLMSLLF